MDNARPNIPQADMRQKKAGLATAHEHGTHFARIRKPESTAAATTGRLYKRSGEEGIEKTRYKHLLQFIKYAQTATHQSFKIHIPSGVTVTGQGETK
mgnify:CR=1 FL=1